MSQDIASGTHLVVGAGAVGSALALALAKAGAQVVIGTRSGSGPVHPGITRIGLDAADANALLAAAPKAAVVYNCVNPPYHRWPQEWPPMAQAFLDFAELSGAVLVTCSNLYGYGPQPGPLHEDLPLAAPGTKGRIRAQMWLEAKAWHDAGRIRASEVRGSDYITPNAQSRLGDRVVPRILKGKGVQLIGPVDTIHTWTSPKDVARLMVIAGADERAWGRAWHVPSNPPRTQQEAVNELCIVAGAKPVKVGQIPAFMVRGLGLVNPLIRELKETAYQFKSPYVLDDSRARATFALEPTPWAVLLDEQVAAYR
ncbi:MAG: NAD-dependent epimerase/dehydratase family protein [Candidatus Nanopelagicales bacterium]